MVRILLTIVILFSVLTARGQLQNAFYLGWNTLKPLSDKDFIDRTSSAGIKIGFSKPINDQFGFGIEGSYNTLHDYKPLETYEFPGGAISTDLHDYMYYFTVTGNLHYYFIQGQKFTPYAALGMGIAFSEYRIFYNVFEDGDRNQSFIVRPEAGTYFRIKEYSNWGLKASLSYDYATNKSDYFELDNFSGISLMVGVVLFTD